MSSKKPITKKKPVVVKVIKARKTNALHEKILKLLSRPNGATITDISDAGFKAATIQALKIAERRGMKTNVVKKPGELTRYVAKQA